MSDSILRLKVENKEYDAKLKHASEGLQRYVDNCRKVGGTLAVVEKETLDYVKALATMDTVSTGAIQKNREMTRVLTDLTIQYRQLTDEEKQSPFGKAMASSIQALTERAAVARDAMKDVNNSINHMSSDTRVFDQIAGSMTLATSATQTYIGVTKLLGIENENNVEIIAKLQAAMSITNGLTQAQTLLQRESAVMQGIQTLQTKTLAAAQALNAKNTKAATVAQEGFNIVAKANPYVLLATVALAAGTAVYAFAKHNKAAAQETKANEEAMNRAKAAADAYQKTVSSTYANLMVKYDELKRSWRSLSTTQERQDWIEKNRQALKDLGLAVTDVQSAESAFENNTSAVVDGFRRRAESAALAARMVELYQQKMDVELNAKELYNSQKVAAYDVVGKRVTSGFTRDAGADTFNEGRYGINAQGQYYFTEKGAKDYNAQLITSNVQLKAMNDEYKAINRQIDAANTKMTQLQSTLATTGAGTGTGTGQDVILPSGSVAELTQRMHDLQEQQKLVTNNSDWLKYQAQIEQIQQMINNIKGETVVLNVEPQIDRVISKSITTSAGLTDYINGLRKSLEDADFGSTLYQSLTSRLADATMLQNLVQESLSVGLGTALFDVADEVGQDFWDRVISPEGVENADWQAIADVINEKRKELGLDAITLDFNTGSISQVRSQQKSYATEDISIKNTQQVINGLSSVASGLQQMGVVIPDNVKNVIETAQGFMSVVQGLSSIAKVIETSVASSVVTAEVANTTATISNTAALLALTTATAAQTGVDTADVVATMIKLGATVAFAKGGMVPRAANGYAVPGTHYSGDTTPILANAGEIILNRAQQGNLVSQLDAPSETISRSSKSYVSGQNIFLGTNNYLKSTGQGELVTTKMLKQFNLIS